ncbi:MAG: DedA family protein [Planctomycetota bacterium]|jgi:membrane protein DedA with SNARE-associated domain|nr:DedA family protein [Planctomycetota bacterium]
MNPETGGAAGLGFVAGLSSWFAAFCVWLADSILALGYPGLVFLMAVESSLIPFPSELVMPPAGYLIHEGSMAWLPVILSGVAGSLLGAVFNYWLALSLGRPFLLRYGKYFFVGRESLEKAEAFFARHGEIAMLVGRLIPVIRQLISLPAGAARMRFGRFCLFTMVGSGIWVTVLTAIGWLVGRNRERLGVYMHGATLCTVAGAAVLVGLYILVNRRRRSRQT